MDISFSIMKKEEIEEATKVAVSSFMDYCFISNYIPEDRREKFIYKSVLNDLSLLFECSVTVVAKDGDKIVAVGNLCEPNYKEPSFIKYVMNGCAKCFIYGGFKDTFAWYRMYTDSVKPCQKYKSYAYLNLMAVEPAYQGDGIGSTMIQKYILPEAQKMKADGVSIYTNKDLNRKFYTKNGAVEFDERFYTYKDKKMGSWSFLLDIK